MASTRVNVALVGGLVLAAAAATAALSRRGPAPPVPAPPLDPPPASSGPAPAPASAAAPASASRPPPRPEEPLPMTMEAQRIGLYRDLATELDLTPEQVAAVRAIVEASPLIGQGNPAISHHAMTPAECRAVRAGLDDAKTYPPCDRRHMVPLYDPGAGETAADARVCIDRFEFPDVPCAYPVVFPTSREAALICAAAGKRICDAHEWEGACAGALRAPEVEYSFGKPRPYATWLHNGSREVRWAYGPQKDHSLCATSAYKSGKCAGGGYKICGTHTWPAGSFPGCVSPLGVYDQHGNAAEHMNLPLRPEELASRGGTGATEMKGSWFVFGREEAHEDDCRWRAKDWHPSALMDEESHRNYHLGFRCCKDLKPSTTPRDPGGP